MVTKCAQVILSLLSPVILLQSYGESEDLRNEVTGKLFAVQMPTKISYRNFILLFAAFAGGIAFIQAFTCERAWYMENSKKLCGWSIGVNGGE